MNLFLWIAVAVLLFWSVGAYNRLVRLRSQVKVAFVELDAQWLRHIELARASLPDEFQSSQLEKSGGQMDDASALWAGLSGATTQFAASLEAMRVRPLHAAQANALRTAQDVLLQAWQHLQTDAHDLAGAAMPDTLSAEWQRLLQDTDRLQAQFNAAVAGYNAAISQFPAVLLAWLFGFRAAASL